MSTTNKMQNSFPHSEKEELNYITLKRVLRVMLGVQIVRASYQTQGLKGGTVGDVRLVTGVAETAENERLPYKLVLKLQKKWDRYGDPGSWRREYDLYESGLDKMFTPTLRWPVCYHSEINDDATETQLWMEYIDGITGLDLTRDMYIRAAEELGRFQGRLYAGRPDVLQNLENLSKAGDMRGFYMHYRSWGEVYDYVRSPNCELPGHLCDMIIRMDEIADEVWRRIEGLPIVFCHRDFWVTNIFHTDERITLIDWDTTGWGHMGEDIISLIADEADVTNMVEYYAKCVPAYFRGFAEYADVSHITDLYISERIILHFGYRLVEWYKFAKTDEQKKLQLDTLQKVYEISGLKLSL